MALSAAEVFNNIVAFLALLFHVCTIWPWAIIKYYLPRNRKDINGEIMFITGAGSGIGRLMACKFAEYGATIICTDINKPASDETAKLIKDKAGKAYSYQLDVTDRHKVYALADTIRSEIGDVTMLVNNAGIVTGRHFLECPDELMIKTMEVNTISHFWTLKAFLGSMIKKNYGHIITIASVAGYSGSPQLVDYTASKFGAVGLHEALTIELWRSANNVKTTSICPWFIKTGMFDGAESGSPFLLPMLEPEDAANQIVNGVLNDESVVFVPRRLTMLVLFKSLCPLNLTSKAADYFKFHNQMKSFKGRSEKKNE